MVPLARSLTSAGHEVAFATAERFCRRVVEPSGFAAYPAGLSPPVVEEQTMRRPEVADLDPGDVSRFGAHMFAGVAGPAMVADLVGIIDRWRPELLVHDAIEFGGPIAAAHRGLTYASHSFGALQPEGFWSLSADLLRQTRKEWEVDPGIVGGMFGPLYLDICPPSLQASHISTVTRAQPLRPVTFDTSGDEELPPWLASMPRRPTIYVTMGTIFNDVPGIFEAVLEALGDNSFNVIATVGRDRDPAELGPQPDCVHVERWIPQSLLFPHCDLVVCHGGSGTTLAALGHGLPLLMLPQGANQFWNAERCAELGIARTLQAHELDAASVRREIDGLLEEPGYRTAAKQVRHEIERMPPPDEVVHRLVALVDEGLQVTSHGG